MDQFQLDDLKRLVEVRANPAVSIYMPTYRGDREVRQNPIRFKNTLSQASAKLAERGMESRNIKQMLGRIAALESDEIWWRNQSDGLAIFLTKEHDKRYRLPRHFDEHVVVNNRFFVKPLVPLLQSDGRFYILAVSQNSVRLFEGTRHTVEELQPETLPKDLKSALNIDEYISSLQFHAADTARGESGGGLFHGHGGAGLDVRKTDEIRQFLRRISDSLDQILKSSDVPLVFMGVDYLFPIFQEACHHKRLIDAPVTGNHELLAPKEIHERAWKVVEPVFGAARRDAWNRYNDLAGSQRATDRLEEIVKSARVGQIDTLLAVTEAEMPGIVDESTGAVTKTYEPSGAAEDLMNYAVVHALANGGKVYSVRRDEMQNENLAVATLRYPLSQRGI